MITRLDVLRAILDVKRPSDLNRVKFIAQRIGSTSVRVSTLLQRLKNQDMVAMGDGNRWYLTNLGREARDDEQG